MMREIKFRVWHRGEKKMYFRGYQKWLHVLLCEDDRGENGGKGLPVRRAGYGDCVFLESSGILDKNRKEIFEGDTVRVRAGGRTFEGVVGPIPDSFGASSMHPLQNLFKQNGLSGPPPDLDIEVTGNEFER